MLLLLQLPAPSQAPRQATLRVPHRPSCHHKFLLQIHGATKCYSTPTASPSASPSSSLSVSPSASPSADPNATPTAYPSSSPSATPNAIPSVTPSATPSGSSQRCAWFLSSQASGFSYWPPYCHSWISHFGAYKYTYLIACGSSHRCAWLSNARAHGFA
jgi:hypothetical protein